jgi:hypothetical protein
MTFGSLLSASAERNPRRAAIVLEKESISHVLRPHAAPYRNSSATPSPRPGYRNQARAKVSITGEKCACREYNTRSRVLCAVVDRVAKPERGLTNNDHNGHNK